MQLAWHSMARLLMLSAGQVMNQEMGGQSEAATSFQRNSTPY